MITTNSPALAEKAKSLKNLSYGKVNKFMHEDIGFNYRLPNISAALSLGQFENINSVFKEKDRIYKRYKKNLEKINGINIPTIKNWATKYIMWVFNVYLDKNFPLTRDELTKKLKEKNIDTRDAFVPINQQQILIDKYKLFNRNDCPNANFIMENGFYLPSGNTLTNEEIDYVSSQVIKLGKN